MDNQAKDKIFTNKNLKRDCDNKQNFNNDFNNQYIDNYLINQLNINERKYPEFTNLEDLENNSINKNNQNSNNINKNENFQTNNQNNNIKNFNNNLNNINNNSNNQNTNINTQIKNNNTNLQISKVNVKTPLLETIEEPFKFSNPKIRLHFIRKVYLILLTQLITTTFFSITPLYFPLIKIFLIDQIYTIFIFIIINIYCLIFLLKKENARVLPWNYVYLFIFTISEGFVLMYITSLLDSEDVLIALFLTSFIFVSLTVFSFICKSDFSACGGICFNFLVILSIGSVLVIFLDGKIFEIFLLGMASFLFGIYIVYDTQVILGGGVLQLGVDDYIVGALLLYVDFIRIFLEILRILAEARGY